jgi:arsenate reductase
MTERPSNIFPEIEKHIKSLDSEALPDERRNLLQPLVDYIQSRVRDKLEVRLNFICTHNSRRSHLSQVWAQTLAAYHNVEMVSCYSGGTEATALFPMVAETLKNCGFHIETLSQGNNPVYSIKFGANAHPIIAFSKTFDDPFNPQSGFAAVMTCSQADEGCPFIAGADLRVPMTFEDPKVFDNTPQQMEKYRERSLQIATELHYVFSNINS